MKDGSSGHFGRQPPETLTIEDKINKAQTEQLFTQFRTALVGAHIVAAALTIGLWNVVPHTWLVAWLVVYVAAQIPRHLLLGRYLRASPRDRDVSRSQTWFTVWNLISSLLWGSAAVLFFAESMPHQFLLAVCVAGIVCGAAAVTWPVTSVYVRTILLVLVPLSARFFYEGDAVHIIAGAMVLVLTGALLLAARHMNRTNVASLRLSFENEALIEELSAHVAIRKRIEDELRMSRDELEVRVSERTAQLANANEQLVQEIAERSRAEKALQESERKYRELAELLPQWVFEIDAKGLFTFANKRGLEASRYTEEDLARGVNVLDVIIPEDVPRIAADIARVLAGERIGPQEYTHRRKDGTTVTLVAEAFPVFRNNEVTGIRGIAVEIEQQKHMERLLTVQRDLARSLSSLSDLNEALSLCLQTALLVSGMDIAGTYLVTEDSGFELVVHEGLSEESVSALSSIAPDSMQASTMLRGQPAYCKQEELGPEVGPIAEREGIRAACIIPVTHEGKVIACLIVASRLLEEVPLATRSTLEAIAGQIGSAITRIMAERKLQQSGQMLKSILATSPIGIGLIKGQRIVWVNQSWKEMFGFEKEEEYLGKSPRIIYSSEEQYDRIDRMIEGRSANLRAGWTAEVDAKCKRKDGSVFDALIREALLDCEDPEQGLIVIISDISSRKKTEEAMRESEAKYRTLFEESVDGVYITERETGTLLEANQSLLDLFGYSREELVGASVLKIYCDPQDRDRFRYDLEKRGSVRDYPLRLCKKNGAPMDCRMTASVLRAKDGTITNYRGLIRDVTPQKSLEKQLVQAQKMEAVGTLAGGIAHEFNNILTIILGFSELLLIDKQEDEPDYSDLQKIAQSARNGADLVKRLMTFSRRAETSPRPIDLNHVVRQAEKLLHRTIPRMIDIQLILASDQAKIFADPGQMEQMLINLCVNAKDAMPHGGQLTIKTEKVTLDEDDCTTHVEMKPGRWILLTVSDSGQGMDKAVLERIFDPFFTTKRGEGTGLGSAMVYGIVTGHGGHITGFSELGCGTTFNIYLPMWELETDEDPATSWEMRTFGTETILLVDDEEFVRELGTRILTRSGYTVLTARDGQEALEIYAREKARVSLVILDLIMPRIGGRQCLAQLLTIDPEVKVIVASGYSAESLVKESIEGGTQGFVPKPFDGKKLLSTVRKVLDKGTVS